MSKDHGPNPLALINTDYINNISKPKSQKIRSKLNRFIPDDVKDQLYLIASDVTIPDDNEKADMISRIMENIGFQEIGTGTNRIAFMKDGYVYKVALDERGFIDNVSEYKRAIEFPKYFAKVYETNRTILICEYCELISEDEFSERKGEIKQILEYLSRFYVMDDIGLTTKNYCNWGLRTNLNSDKQDLVIIDNAYFYPIRNNTQMLTCFCGHPIAPNSLFTGYQCTNSACACRYSVEEILNKAGFDFDNDDTRIISALENGTEDGSSKVISLTGNDSGELKFIDPSNKEYIDKVNEAYKSASEVQFEPNAIDSKDIFGGSDDDNEMPSKETYIKLNEVIKRRNNQ